MQIVYKIMINVQITEYITRINKIKTILKEGNNLR